MGQLLLLDQLQSRTVSQVLLVHHLLVHVDEVRVANLLGYGQPGLSKSWVVTDNQLVSPQFSRSGCSPSRPRSPLLLAGCTRRDCSDYIRGSSARPRRFAFDAPGKRGRQWATSPCCFISDAVIIFKLAETMSPSPPSFRTHSSRQSSRHTRGDHGLR